MRPLSASNLLEIWERGLGKTPLEQALVILAVAFPQAAWDTLAKLTIEQRDTTLFHLREQTFGSQLKGLADCPACGEKLELTFTANDLRSMGLLPNPTLSLPDTNQAGALLRRKGYEIHFRLPTSADLLNIERLAEVELAHRHLLEACIISARHRKNAVPFSELPSPITQAIIEQIGQSAALANLTIESTCPDCGQQWKIVFDVVSYFWSEINAWAMRMMREIHVIASSYGWSEADILAMSAWRRQRYLELIGD
ncbi:MAG TPA: phage baseplate protein [Anaerolineae bacterium]|jgi:uncharacterized protein (UPF0212 family)|nr:phage baseplate protein [Anaerolineae bacterium]